MSLAEIAPVRWSFVAPDLLTASITNLPFASTVVCRFFWLPLLVPPSLHVPLSTNFIFVISPATESAWKVIFRNLWWPFFWEVVPL